MNDTEATSVMASISPESERSPQGDVEGGVVENGGPRQFFVDIPSLVVMISSDDRKEFQWPMITR